MDVLSRIRMPNLAAAPSSPAKGELYYDTAADILYWWNGTTWVAAGSAGGSTPSGPAGGDLAGTYPDPQLAAGVIVDADVNTAAAILGRKFQWSKGTSPPASPADNDIWLYSGSGYAWFFIYDSSEATYKWKFVGGGDAVTAVATDQTYTEGASFADATTAGPTFTVPRAGDYTVEYACNQYVASQAAAGQQDAQVLASSGTWDGTGSTGGAAISGGYTTGGSVVGNNGADAIRGIAASGTLKMQYRAAASIGGTAHTRWRVLRVRPIRVS